MVQVKIQTGVFALTALVFSCGGNEQTDLSQTNLQETIQATQDTANTTLTEVQQTESEEELLAENLEPVTDEAPDYVETEMKEVVLTRKTPVPSSVENNPFGVGDEDNGGGNGTGWGDGKTVDRNIIKSPTIVNPTTEKAIVSVKVKVDSDGNVVDAESLQSNHTNTTNSKLLRAAEKHAYQYQFEADASIFVSNQIIDIKFE